MLNGVNILARLSPLKPGASAAEDIIAFCRKLKSPVQSAPAPVVFGALPKTSTGKIQNFPIREQARKMT